MWSRTAIDANQLGALANLALGEVREEEVEVGRVVCLRSILN